MGTAPTDGTAHAPTGPAGAMVKPALPWAKLTRTRVATAIVGAVVAITSAVFYLLTRSDVAGFLLIAGLGIAGFALFRQGDAAP